MVIGILLGRCLRRTLGPVAEVLPAAAGGLGESLQIGEARLAAISAALFVASLFAGLAAIWPSRSAKGRRQINFPVSAALAAPTSVAAPRSSAEATTSSRRLGSGHERSLKQGSHFVPDPKDRGSPSKPRPALPSLRAVPLLLAILLACTARAVRLVDEAPRIDPQRPAPHLALADYLEGHRPVLARG